MRPPDSVGALSPLPPYPSESLRTRVLEAAQRERSLTRGSVGALTTVLAVAVAAFFVLLLAAEGWVHWVGRPVPFIVGTAAGWAATAAFVTWVVFGRAGSMIGHSRRFLWLAAVGTPAALFGWMLAWNLLYPQTLRVCTGRIGLVCLDMTVTIAALPLLVLALWRARLDPVHPGATGAALGAAMGAWAGFTIDLSCECTNPAHILLGHILPLVLLVGIGSWLGYRSRSWRGAKAAPAAARGDSGR